MESFEEWHHYPCQSLIGWLPNSWHANVLARQKLPIFLANTWFATKSCQYITLSLPKWWQVFRLYFGLPKLWQAKI